MISVNPVCWGMWGAGGAARGGERSHAPAWERSEKGISPGTGGQKFFYSLNVGNQRRRYGVRWIDLLGELTTADPVAVRTAT